MATPHKIALAAAYRAAKIAYVATIRKLAQEDNRGSNYRAKLQEARSSGKVASSVNPRMVRLARNMKRKYGA